MTVRDAVLADVPAIAALERESFSLPWTEEAVRAQLAGPGRLLLAAEEAGALAGYIGLQYVLDEGYITNVCTAPACRRRGVATALLAALRARAEALGLAFLTLEVRESNRAARALYEKHGFAAAGRRPRYYERPVEDALLLTLYLKEA